MHPNLATCEKCGQSIKYVVTLKSTDGQVMSVGQDCAVTLAGGPELAEIRSAERKWEHEQWLISPEGVAWRAEQDERPIRMARIAALNADRFALWIAGIREILTCPRVADWPRKILQGVLQTWENGNRDAPFTPGDESIFLGAMRDVLLPESSYHAADVGKRVDLTVWYEYSSTFEAMGYRGLEMRYVWNLRDSGGRRYVWISSSWLPGLDKREDRGTVLRVRATIKGKDEFRGTKQTKLTRVAGAK